MRHDHRHRPGRRTGRRAGGVRVVRRAPVVLVASSLLVGILILAAWAFLGLALVILLFEQPAILAVVVGGILLLGHRRRRRRRLGAAGTVPLPARRPPPPRPDLAWQRARARFTALRSEYAAHECDPMAVLRLPALSDVAVPSTARFVDAFAEAQALETDTFPPGGHAASFVHAVERAVRAWSAAREAAERIRLSKLTLEERTSVERVIKLLTTARDSDNDAERLAAYSRAHAELARLDRAGVIHLPRTARAMLEEASRGQLPA